VRQRDSAELKIFLSNPGRRSDWSFLMQISDARYGYADVPTDTQDLTNRVTQLKAAGSVVVIFTTGAMVVALLTVSACATVHQTYAPDGRKAYTLNCSGLARGWDKCLSAAGELCASAGYDILDRSSEDAAVAGAGGSPSGGSAFAAKTNERSMLIACKAR
jgi:hypothetical protein